MKSLGECSSSLSIFEFLGQLSILLAFSGSFAVKNDNIRIFSLLWLQILNLPAAPK